MELIQRIKPYPITAGICLICLLFFGLTQLQMLAVADLLFPKHLYSVTTLTQPWRLLTPILLHHNAIHLLGNLVVWVEFSRQIEANMPRTHLLWLVPGIGLIGNLSEYFVKNHQFGGLSGVALGIAGYTFARSLHRWNGARWHFPAIYGIAILIWVTWGFLDSTQKLANGAHLGGLISGVALGGWFSWQDRTGSQ